MQRSFSVGETLSDTFGLYLRRFPEFLAIGAVFAAPQLLLGDVIRSDAAGVLVGMLQDVLVTASTCAAAVVVATAGVEGRPMGVFAALKTLGPRWRAIAGATLAVSLLKLPGDFADFAEGSTKLLALFGNVWAIFIACLFLPAPAVAAAEPVGGLEALARARFLTAGERWKLLGLQFLLGLLGRGAALTLSMTAGAVAGDTFGTSALVAFLGAALTAPLGAVAAATSYVALRTAREGAPTRSLSDVFG
ncbi:MAG TPA: hypothetical protein VEI02_09225 [Planctomycetota bacterium]|nr:hypothetical protein [Planctomycetota bacterium]